MRDSAPLNNAATYQLPNCQRAHGRNRAPSVLNTCTRELFRGFEKFFSGFLEADLTGLNTSRLSLCDCARAMHVFCCRNDNRSAMVPEPPEAGRACPTALGSTRRPTLARWCPVLAT